MRIHCIWINVSAELSEDVEITLPEYALIALKSFVQYGNGVTLWSLQTINGLGRLTRNGLAIKSLTRVKDRELLQGWVNKSVHVMHISDVLRAAIIAKYGGLYCDIDAIALRPLQNLLQRDYIFGWQFIFPCQ